jgi:hypothetical protein
MYRITMYSHSLLTYFHNFSVYLFQEHRCQIGAFQEFTRKFGIPPKISITPGVYLTWRGSVQRLLTSGPRGWLTDETPWPVGPTLQPLIGWHRYDTLQEAVERNPMLKVDGGRTPWPAVHVARPAGHYLVCYQLYQVSNPSLDSYKYPPTSGNQSNTHYLVVLHL